MVRCDVFRSNVQLAISEINIFPNIFGHFNFIYDIRTDEILVGDKNISFDNF